MIIKLGTILGLATVVAIPVLLAWYLLTVLLAGRIRTLGGDYARTEKPIPYWIAVVVLAAFIAGSTYRGAMIAADAWHLLY